MVRHMSYRIKFKRSHGFCVEEYNMYLHRWKYVASFRYEQDAIIFVALKEAINGSKKI